MNLKEQILLKAGEEIKPVKKLKPKKKVIKETIKLSSLLETLLLEAVDVSSGEKVIRALERGQIPGLKKKLFLSTDKEESEIVSVLDQAINILKPRVDLNSFNSYLFLMLKKFGNIDSIEHNISLVSEFIDAMSSYFGNVNKQEVKQDARVRARFEKFFNSPFNFKNDKEFEQWANKKFAQKARAKDQDIVEVYRNNQGWTVHIPKTFAAASKLACMADRKARWCTAASVGMFKTYSSESNPLYIVRNENKNFMLQMDWGNGARSPNFKDEKDVPISVRKILQLDVPDDVWQAIKNRSGKSVYYYLQQALEIKKEEEKGKKSKSEELREKTNWKVEEVDLEETRDKIQQIDKDIEIRAGNSWLYKQQVDDLSVEQILKDTLRDDREKQKDKAEGTKVFKFTSDKGRELYGVLGTVQRFIRKNPRSRPKEYFYTNAFIEIEGNSVKIIDKGDIISGNETGIPDELKKEFFKGTDFEKLESKKIEEIDGVFEIDDLDFLLKKRDLFEDPLAFTRFKNELDNSSSVIGDGNIYVKKENNGNVSAVWFYGNGIHVVKYTKDKNTVNYSNKYGADSLKKFPDKVKDKILNSIEDEDMRSVFTNTMKNNEFVHPLLGGEYYYDMVNNNILDKDKNVISSVSDSFAVTRRVKKEKSQEEYNKFLHQKSVITRLKTGLKNTLEKERLGFSGEVTLSKIRSNKELFRGKMEKALNKLSISNIEISDSEKQRIVNEILNGTSKKIKLAETTMDLFKPAYSNKVSKTFEVELYYDENKERAQSEFYYLEKKEPYFAIGFVKSSRFGGASLKSQATYLEDGKVKGHGYVNVRTKERTSLYVDFVKQLFEEMKAK